MLVRVWTHLNDIKRDQRGVSAVEFALLMPLLIMIYFGLAESTQMLLADRRISQVAFSVGDLVSRTDQVDDAQMADIFTVARVIMEPFPVSTVMGIRVTSIAVAADGRASVVWSDANGTLGAHLAGAPILIEGNRVAPGETVVLSEVTYQYRGASSMILADGMTLRAQFYLKPRKSDAVLRVRP
jgi:Flp pilus assembly protein TadG